MRPKDEHSRAVSYSERNFCWPLTLRCCFFLVCCLCFTISAFAQGSASLRGVVRSSQGELLAGVTIQVKNTRRVIQTGRDGTFDLDGLPLKCTLVFSRLGYKMINLDLGLIASIENVQDITLYPEVQSLDEIHITEKFSGSNFKTMEPGQLRDYPNPTGSFESLIKTMPGVSATNELSSQYSVRGGNFTENLLYLNDIQIFRPLLVSKGQQDGLGFLNPDLTQSIRFSAGGFEARYGDKLSSVLDVRYARPDTFSLQAAAGLIGSSATVKVPFKNSYLLGGVRNNRNEQLLESQGIPGDYSSDFSDYQMLYRQAVTPEFNVSLFGNFNRAELDVRPGRRATEFGTSDEVLQLFVNYSGKEHTRAEVYLGALTMAYNISDAFSIKWINSVSRIKESEQTALLGWYTFDQRESDTEGILGRGSQYDFASNSLTSVIHSSELRAYRQLNRSFLEIGLRLQRDQFDDNINEYIATDSTGYSQPGSLNWVYSDPVDSENSLDIKRVSGFLQNTFSVGPYFTIAAGVRANYNSFSEELLLSPRLSLMYSDRPDKFLLKFSAGSYVQAPSYPELKSFDGSLNENAKAQRSFQMVGGADLNFKGLGTDLKFSSEVYYKFLSHLTPYKIEDMRLRYFSDQQSSGYATGADFRLSGTFAKGLESSFRMSFMKTMEDIEGDIKMGNPPVHPGYLRRPSDQRLNVGMLFQDRLQQNPTYKVHLNLLFGTSLPTGPSGSERHEDVFTIPAYKRVDIGFSKNFADPESKRIIPFVQRYFQSLSAHAEIFNLLNFKNTISYFWLRDVNDIQYAVPNYLTYRKFNLKLVAVLKSRK